MGDFYLHIGMHKTASTSCQLLFDTNAELLAAEGVRYFRSLEPNHSPFLINFFETERRDGGGSAGAARTSPRYATEGEQLWRRWLDFIAETGASGDDALLSGEVGGFLTARSVRQLRDRVLAHFDRMIVLMLVRPPLSFAHSATQQRLKGGHPLEALATGAPNPKYRRRLATYISALGARRVRLEIFHPDRMTEGDPAQTLFAMMDRATPALAELRAPRSNAAMSAPAAKLLSALHVISRDPTRADDLPAPVIEALRALPAASCDFAGVMRGDYARRALPRGLLTLAREIPGDRFVLPREVQARTVALAREDTAWASAQVGADIAAYDIAPDPAAPTLEQVIRIDDRDAEAIAVELHKNARQPG